MWMIALLGAGCVLVTDAEWDRATDRDRDGFVAWQLGGSDCDDADGGVHPDAPELCGDAVDNNCDRLTDDSGIGAVVWYVDADDDGYGVLPANSACEAPPGSVNHLVNGEDCNDEDRDTHPGAPDSWYDGIDRDCLGNSDWDQDGDGYTIETAVEGTADDCTDAGAVLGVPASWINPGAIETWYDGIDQDCDGWDDWDQDRDGHSRDGAPTGTADDCADAATSHLPDPAAVHPAAAEVWYDGVDENCDGASDWDQDGETVADPIWSPADFDGSPDVRPGPPVSDVRAWLSLGARS